MNCGRQLVYVVSLVLLTSLVTKAEEHVITKRGGKLTTKRVSCYKQISSGEDSFSPQHAELANNCTACGKTTISQWNSQPAKNYRKEFKRQDYHWSQSTVIVIRTCEIVPRWREFESYDKSVTEYCKTNLCNAVQNIHSRSLSHTFISIMSVIILRLL